MQAARQQDEASLCGRQPTAGIDFEDDVGRQTFVLLDEPSFVLLGRLRVILRAMTCHCHKRLLRQGCLVGHAGVKTGPGEDGIWRRLFVYVSAIELRCARDGRRPLGAVLVGEIR